MTSESIPVPPEELNTSGSKTTTDAIPAQPTESQEWHGRLDRFLLFWIAGELGYLILLIIGIVVIVIIGFTDSSALSSLRIESYIIFPALLLVVAFLVNLVVGFAGLILHIRMKYSGYPGTGHLLNWIYILSSFWLFILIFVLILPQILFIPFLD